MLLGLIWSDSASASAFCLLIAFWPAAWIAIPLQPQSSSSYFGYSSLDLPSSYFGYSSSFDLSYEGSAFFSSQHSPPDCSWSMSCSSSFSFSASDFASELFSWSTDAAVVAFAQNRTLIVLVLGLDLNRLGIGLGVLQAEGLLAPPACTATPPEPDWLCSTDWSVSLSLSASASA